MVSFYLYRNHQWSHILLTGPLRTLSGMQWYISCLVEVISSVHGGAPSFIFCNVHLLTRMPPVVTVFDWMWTSSLDCPVWLCCNLMGDSDSCPAALVLLGGGALSSDRLQMLGYRGTWRRSWMTKSGPQCLRVPGCIASGRWGRLS